MFHSSKLICHCIHCAASIRLVQAYVAMVIAWLACDNRRNQLYIMHNVSAGRPHATLDQLVTRMTQFAHLHEVTGVAAMDSEQDHVRQALVILKVCIKSTCLPKYADA
jgi:hypothetical protein